MLHAQNQKVAVMVEPQTIGTTAVSGYVDTLGYNHARILYVGGPVATGGVPGTLKLREGDTTSSFTDISGAVGGTDFTITTPNTSNGDVIAFDVDLRKPRDRYIALTVTGTATTRTTSAIAILSRAEQTPNSDAEAGCDEIVFV